MTTLDKETLQELRNSRVYAWAELWARFGSIISNMETVYNPEKLTINELLSTYECLSNMVREYERIL